MNSITYYYGETDIQQRMNGKQTVNKLTRTAQSPHPIRYRSEEQMYEVRTSSAVLLIPREQVATVTLSN